VVPNQGEISTSGEILVFHARNSCHAGNINIADITIIKTHYYLFIYFSNAVFRFIRIFLDKTSSNSYEIDIKLRLFVHQLRPYKRHRCVCGRGSARELLGELTALPKPSCSNF